MKDPWEVQRWAFQQTTGNAARKAVLMALAVMAEMSSGRCEAKIAHLVEWTELSERSVQSHLKLLKETGFIAMRPQWRRDGGQRGNEFLLLLPGVTEWPDGERVQDSHPPGEVDSTPPVQPAAPQELPLGNGHASKQDDPRARLPDGFPEELRPHGRVVYGILRQIAEDHGAKKVWPKALGQVLMAHPKHPLVATANAFAAWAVDPPRKITDVVGTYRTFLKRENQLEATERLDVNGVPSGRVTVYRGGGRRESASDLLRALNGDDVVEGSADEVD